MTHFASPGLPLDALVAVDQKANTAYPGFYNGGGSHHGAWPGDMGDVSPPVGSRGKDLVGPWGTKSLEAEAKCEISVQLLTFSCRKFRI